MAKKQISENIIDKGIISFPYENLPMSFLIADTVTLREIIDDAD